MSAFKGPVTIDFETTNVDPKIAHPVEIALFGEGVIYNTLIKPPVPIPVETSAIHHIVDSDVSTSPEWPEVKTALRSFADKMENKIFIAHNAEYEQGIIKEGFEDLAWICTYKCALILYPDAPSYKNEVLRYYLGLSNLGRLHPQNAHNAFHDCVVTFELFQKMLELATVEQMIKWSKEPKAFRKISFGKHIGQTWDMIPGDYLSWICKQVDMDRDVVYCAGKELDRRKVANATPRSR